jgi:hypothetical protein
MAPASEATPPVQQSKASGKKKGKKKKPGSEVVPTSEQAHASGLLPTTSVSAAASDIVFAPTLEAADDRTAEAAAPFELHPSLDLPGSVSPSDQVRCSCLFSPSRLSL